MILLIIYLLGSIVSVYMMVNIVKNDNIPTDSIITMILLPILASWIGVFTSLVTYGMKDCLNCDWWEVANEWLENKIK